MSIPGPAPALCRALLTGTLLLVMLAGPVARADEVLVAHPSVDLQDLSLNTTRLMFSMQLDRWPDGERVRVFVLPDDDPTHRAFTKDHLSLYPRQLRRVWDRQLYSGTGQAPETVSDVTEMRQRIAATPGAVGYLPSEMINDSVRVLRIQ